MNHIALMYTVMKQEALGSAMNKTVKVKGTQLQGGGVVTLDGVVRDGLSKIGISEQRPGGMRPWVMQTSG